MRLTLACQMGEVLRFVCHQK